MQPAATALGTTAGTGTTSDPATAALATSAPVGTNAPVPVAAAATTSPVATSPALTTPAYNYADNVSSGQALQDLTDFQTKEVSPVDAYNAAVTQLGIPDVRSNVTALRSQIANTTALLNALPDSVSGRTSGSLVTDAQRSRILGMESAPLTTTLNQQSSNYNTESANLNDLTSQAQTQAGLVTEGNKNISDALQTRYTGIQNAEATKAAADAAQRQFDLTVQQIQAQQAQFAQTFAQSQKAFAEQQREFNVSSAASAAAASATTPTQANQQLLGELQNIATQYKSTLGSNPNGLRESIIQQLTSKYGAYVDPKVISNLVYNTYIPNSVEQANEKAASTNNQKALVSKINSIAGIKY